ncbi:MAG: hypothetical protein EOO44_11095 [Flavobacterium sp.]|nr:MAG: hypothetical protein EOO44_11095 [Flavobacterium sp.]
MNKITQIISVLLLVVSFSCCSKEDNTEEETAKETIDKKWIVENSEEFKSIEFDTNGNYIITKNANSIASKKTLTSKTAEEIIVFGTYEVLDTDILLLSDFGTIKVDDSDPTNVVFSIKYEGSDTYNYELKVSKAAEITTSPNTDLLCHSTWKLTRNEPIHDTVSLINFSKAGTCFTSFNITSQNGQKFLQFGKWQWQDKDETKIKITEIKNAQWILDKDGEVEFEITKMGVKLEMRETFEGKAHNNLFDTITVAKTKKTAVKKVKSLKVISNKIRTNFEF